MSSGETNTEKKIATKKSFRSSLKVIDSGNEVINLEEATAFSKYINTCFVNDEQLR
jgi:hypothetical protein